MMRAMTTAPKEAPTAPSADPRRQAEPPAGAPALGKPTLGDYAFVAMLLAATTAALVVAARTGHEVMTSAALRAPMAGMLALTAVVWLSMVLVRNGSVMLGRAQSAYYVDYVRSPPPDWVERPARTFNNLMQVPTLFYVACLFMMQSPQLEVAQVRIAWLFVVLRTLHAGAYIGWNWLPSRFGLYLASCTVLIVLWLRILL